MAVVRVEEAETRFIELLTQEEGGEEVVLTRGGVPVARLERIQARPQRNFGTVPLRVPPTFFQTLAENELSEWE